jgi:hypothetical protein
MIQPDTDTSLFDIIKNGTIAERFGPLCQGPPDTITEDDSMAGFVYVENDAYLPLALYNERQRKQYVNSRKHLRRTYTSVRQSDRKYRNVRQAAK